MKEDIIRLRSKGLSYSQIKNILGCSLSTISHHCGVKGEHTWSRITSSKEEIESLAKESVSYRDLVIKLGYKPKPSKQKSIKRLCIKYGVDVTHFLGKGHNKGKTSIKKTKEEFISSELVVKLKKSSSHRLKLKLYRYGIKEESCEICSLNKWQNKKISLHLDHINGNPLDDRLDNLRVLCPNCHSQTDTYAGKNIGNNVS